MEQCKHSNCNQDKRIWISKENLPGSDISPHPWCINCGKIKNISDDKSYHIGYWINILAKINHYMPLTQCQKRLIVKEMEDSECFQDLYSISGSIQKRVFISIVRKYCKITENWIHSIIC